MEIVGRTREQRILTQREESGKPEFIAVYGRRRVGKTYLITEHFDNKFTFQTTGIYGGSLKDQLGAFHTSLMQAFKTSPQDMPENWFGAFEQLRRQLESDITPGRKVLFIDEMPWLDTHKSKFLPALEHFWNSYASRNRDIMLIVCGSAASWIIGKLLENYGGLYNRVTATIVVEPFNLQQCEAFYNSRGIVMSRQQIAEAYMILGGVPFYMDSIDKMFGLYQNIDMLFFDKNAKLGNEFDRLYNSLFKNAGNHIRIAQALAGLTVGMTRKELSEACGISNGGGLTQVLGEMEACGLISGTTDYLKRKDGDYYCLTDFFSIFYFTFLASRRNSDPHFWTNYLSYPAHRAWCGYAFERLCIAHIAQIKQKLGISGVISDSYTFRSARKEGGAQIDLIIDRRDGVVNLCECKFSVDLYKLTDADASDLRRKKNVFVEESKTKKAIHTTMITSNGLAQSPHRNEIQSELTLDDLFLPLL